MLRRIVKYGAFLAVVLVSVFCLAACSSGGASTSADKDSPVVITQSDYHTYMDTEKRFGTELFGEMKNQGNDTVQIKQVTIELFDSEKKSIGKVKGMFAPEYLKPGDSGLFSYQIPSDGGTPKIEKYGQVASISAVVSFSPVKEYENNTLMITSAKIKISPANDIPEVETTIENTYEQDVLDYNAIAGVYDSKGKLLACYRNDKSQDKAILKKWNQNTFLNGWPDNTDVKRFDDAKSGKVYAYVTKFGEIKY
ncbi:MAG: hypothetical protein IJG85_02725 [Eubacteriaceae bacterium]|nr:hypothetical protein [Eubacteriaceae bacterium]